MKFKPKDMLEPRTKRLQQNTLPQSYHHASHTCFKIESSCCLIGKLSYSCAEAMISISPLSFVFAVKEALNDSKNKKGMIKHAIIRITKLTNMGAFLADE